MALVGLWVHPVGLGSISEPITAVATTAALAIAFLTGLRTRSAVIPLVAAAASLTGLAVGWFVTNAIEPRDAGDGIVAAWSAYAVVTGVVAGLGVALRRQIERPGVVA
jgi:hypothetical protein